MYKITLRALQSGSRRRKLDGYWNPSLSIENAMGDVGTQTDTEVLMDDSGQAFVTETKRIRGTFSELLELNYFPFDIQVTFYFLFSLFIRPVSARCGCVTFGLQSSLQQCCFICYFRHKIIIREGLTSEYKSLSFDPCRLTTSP